MKNPKLISKPFAQNGQKNVIPEKYETSMESNQATWDQGFGQITMLPVSAGGLPPKGQDFNGILNQMCETIVHISKGGAFKFSADYATAINGYPKGAILQSEDEKKYYQSIIDNNKVNFNTASQDQIKTSWKLVMTDDLLDQLSKKLESSAVVQSTGTSTTSVMSQKASTDAFQPKGDYADGKRFASTAIETRVVDSDGSGYIYVNNANKATGFISKGNAVWRFDGSGVLTDGTIPFSRMTGVYSQSQTDAELNKKIDKSSISQQLANDVNKVPSLDLVAREIGGRQPKGDYADGKRFASTTIETRVVDSDGSGYIYVNNANKATGFISKGNAVWRFDGSGVLTDGTIPFSRMTGVNADSNGIVRTGDATALVKEDVTQSTGTSTTSVMSQKASTDVFQPKGDYAQAGSSYTKSESDARYEKSGIYKQWRKVGDFNGASAVVEITLSENILGKYVYVQRDGGGETYTGFLVPPISGIKLGVPMGQQGYWDFIVSQDGRKLKLTDSSYGSAKGVYVLD